MVEAFGGLTCAAGGVKYVALNPPSALARRHEEHP